MRENSIRKQQRRWLGIFRTVAAAFGFTLLSLATRGAQQSNPHLGYVYPAGGRQGTTFQVVIGGQNLVDPVAASISGEGVQAKVLDYNRPLTQKEFNELWEELRGLQEKRRAANRRSQSSTNVWTATDDRKFDSIRSKLLKSAPNRDGNPAIAENVRLQITVAAEAEPGEREIRIVSARGLSNPLVFCVDQLPEFTAPVAKAANPELERFQRQLENRPGNTNAPSEMRVSLPGIVNGQIMPGEVDRFRFNARKGQQFVAAVSARRLVPYLADAVPGWFQATLTLYDPSGKALVYEDDFRFHPDPVLHCIMPLDGDYVLEIKDSIFRGREDFVYRIGLGELPFITDMFPLGGPAGSLIPVKLNGWNLPVRELMITTMSNGPARQAISVRQNGLASNRLLFAVDTLPESQEKEPNNSLQTAELVTLPIMINGRIGAPDDVDVFHFEGQAGQQLVAEVYARRLDSPLDSVLKLTDANGSQLAFNDDQEDKGSGLNTHHADSYLRATIRTNGAYYLQLRDAQHKGGEAYAYRLRLSAPRPNFELRVTPSSITARPGVAVQLTAYVLRRDGFTNQVTLRLKEGAANFRLNGGVIPAQQDKIQFSLTPSKVVPAGVLNLAFEGCATLGDTVLTQPAVPADEMMQAFAYWHMVPMKEMQVTVLNRGKRPQ